VARSTWCRGCDVLDEVEDLSRHGLVEIAGGLVREEKGGAT